jgi:hypothetical protein
MLSRCRCVLTLICAVVSCLYAAPVHADPITVTSGGVFLNWDGSSTTISMRGSDLSIFGSGVSGAPGGWEAGTIGDMNALFRFEVRAANPPIEVIVNGTSYRAYLEGELAFKTAGFLVPPSSTGLFATTFAMSGRVRGFATPSVGGPAPALFDVLLTGRGTASTSATPLAGGTFYRSDRGINYGFESPAATPEPASLLLLGTGVAGLAVRSRKRSRS